MLGRAERQGLVGPVTTSNLTETFECARSDLTGRDRRCHVGVEDDRDGRKSHWTRHDHRPARARAREKDSGEDVGWGC